MPERIRYRPGNSTLGADTKGRRRGGAAATTSAAATRPGSRVEAAGARAGSAARARRAQKERRSASSIWREGALMFAASERSSTPKLAELRFPIGTSKLARSKAFSTWNTASIP